MKRFPLTLSAALGVGLIAIGGAALAQGGALVPKGCVDDETGPDGCAQTAAGLAGALSVALTADGRSAYVASLDDDALVRFKRDTRSGALTPKGCVDDDDTGPDACAQSADGLDGAYAAAVSGDGRSVYVASAGDSALVHFKRDTRTGAVTPKGCVDDDDTGPDACAQSADGLGGAWWVAVSGDGRSVYVAAREDSALVHFKRNPRTGALTPRGCVDDNDSGPDECAQSVNGLNDARFVTVSPDGGSVYVVSLGDHAVVHFKRNTRRGALIPKGCVDDGDIGPDDCAQSVKGLGGPYGAGVSPDSESVYVAATGDDDVVRFERNRRTGALTPRGCVEDDDTGAGGCARSADGLDGARAVTVSPDGGSAYVAGREDNSLVDFKRRRTGVLIPKGCVDDNDTGPDECAQSTDGLASPRTVAISGDGGSVYVASQADDAVVRFRVASR